MMRIAVFGDIHGRLALTYTLCHLWQQHHGESIDAILQVGDMGAYPDHTRLDRATLRHAKRDPDELGYASFVRETAEAEHYFGLLDAPLYFVRGNHEDFDYLARFQKPTVVDPFGRMTFIPDGGQVRLAAPGAPTVAAFGGIAPRVEDRGRGRKARDRYRRAQRRADHDPRFFDPRLAERAFLAQSDIDILLTHNGPAMNEFPAGSEALSALLRRLRPAWHFFGHHHRVLGPLEGPGGCQVVGLEHLDFSKSGELREGSWGIFEWSDEPQFHFVDVVSDPWLKSLRRQTYRSFVGES